MIGFSIFCERRLFFWRVGIINFGYLRNLVFRFREREEERGGIIYLFISLIDIEVFYF